MNAADVSDLPGALAEPDTAALRARVNALLSEPFLAEEGCYRTDKGIVVQVSAVPSAPPGFPISTTDQVNLRVQIGSRLMPPPASPEDVSADLAEMELCLQDLRQNEEPHRRLAACQRLGQLAHPAGEAELRRVATSDPDAQVRTAAREALADAVAPRFPAKAFADQPVKLYWQGTARAKELTTNAQGQVVFELVPARMPCRLEWIPGPTVLDWRQRLANALAASAASAPASLARAIREWLAELDRELEVGWALLLDRSQRLAAVAVTSLSPGYECHSIARFAGIGDATELAEFQAHLGKADNRLQSGCSGEAKQELMAACRLNAHAVQAAEVELHRQGRRVGFVVVDGRRGVVSVKALGGGAGIRPAFAVLLSETGTDAPRTAVFAAIAGEEPNRLAVFEGVPDGCFQLAVGPLESSLLENRS
jgi:hypothetical protein